LPRRSAGAAIPESVRTMMLVWKNLRMVKTGIATQRVSPRDTEMTSDDIDISDTSNSAKRNCRQNISDGCTMVGTSLIPCGTTRPSIRGRVRSLSESAMLSSGRESVLKEKPRRPAPEPILGCRRDAHIDAVVAHFNVDRPQAIFGVTAVAAGFDVEFPAVPGTDDVALLGETQAAAGLVRRKLLLDARDHLALTDRTSVVRAMILI